MYSAVLCSVRLQRIVPGQVTLTCTNVLHVHQSAIIADSDLPAKDINLGRGSYGRMFRGRRVRGRRVVGSG